MKLFNIKNNIYFIEQAKIRATKNIRHLIVITNYTLDFT